MYIFYCAGGKFGEVTGVFLAEEHSLDAGSEAPDAVSERPVQTVPGPARVRHRTQACASGDPASLRSSLRMGPVCTGRARSASGALQVTVRLLHVDDVGAPDAGVERPVPL